MPSNNRDILICTPTWTGRAAVISKIMNCDVCGQDVWVSPASLIAAGANSRIVCTSCINTVIGDFPTEEIKIDPPTEGQFREIRDSFG
jgi:hypothetical protein